MSSCKRSTSSECMDFDDDDPCDDDEQSQSELAEFQTWLDQNAPESVAPKDPPRCASCGWSPCRWSSVWLLFFTYWIPKNKIVRFHLATPYVHASPNIDFLSTRSVIFAEAPPSLTRRSSSWRWSQGRGQSSRPRLLMPTVVLSSHSS